MKRMMTTAAAIAALAALALAGCSKGGDAEKAAKAEASGGGSAARPAGMPKPRTGLWRMTSEMPDLGAKMPPQDVCLTPEMVNDPEWSKAQMPKDIDCPVMTTNYVGGVIVAHSVCHMNGTKMTSDIRTSGDFQNRYTVESTSSVEPAPPGLKNPTRMIITAERLGDC